MIKEQSQEPLLAHSSANAHVVGACGKIPEHERASRWEHAQMLPRPRDRKDSGGKGTSSSSHQCEKVNDEVDQGECAKGLSTIYTDVPPSQMSPNCSAQSE